MSDSLPLVAQAGYEVSLKPMKHCDRTADFNVMIYLTKGKMEIFEDDILYELTPYTLFFLKSGVRHYGIKDFEIGSAWFYTHFYCSEPNENILPYEIMQNNGDRLYLTKEDCWKVLDVPKFLHLTPDNKIADTLSSLVKKHNSGDILRASIEMMNVLCEAAYPSDKPFSGDSRLDSVVKYIEDNYTSAFSSHDIENAVGLSYKYIGTIFKEHMGVTIKEFALSLRIKKAVSLLCETDMNTCEIADLTGFYDTYHFSKIFKREKGISPTEFRKAYIPKI